ncbi:MAG: hypothetical protein AAB697_03110 [Patescibacteria group bacterium]
MKRSPALNSEKLRSKLKLKHLTTRTTLLAHHPHVAKFLASSALAGTLLLTPGQSTPTFAALPASSISQTSSFDLHQHLADKLKEILPGQVQPLTADQESQISQTLHDLYGIHATAELEGNHLNTSYGLIGAEQHLMRYPGDVVENMAPGRGAWGYFAPSKEALTPDLVEKEKYYAVVQTLYLPDWSTRLAYLRDWYKYRKVLIVNTQTGKAIVASIADSGPAAWTGKHYGGSPEVMAYLGLNVGKQKGPVVLFFIDDPADQIPLGPLEYNLENPPLLTNG